MVQRMMLRSFLKRSGESDLQKSQLLSRTD